MHSVNIKEFSRVTYTYKGEEKKIALVDKAAPLSSLKEEFKMKLNGFPLHRFNVYHTKEQIENLLENLKPNEIVKFQDFSQNYTCLLPEEIMSIHWVQQTATLYPVAVVRKVNDVIREDHLVFISDDTTHDVAFVETCNNVMHEYYKSEGLNVLHDYEINHVCGRQFKSRKAVAMLSHRLVKTTRLWFESSHGKNRSDGIGGQVKGKIIKF